MGEIKAVVVDPDAPNRLALAAVEEPSPSALGGPGARGGRLAQPRRGAPGRG